MSPQQIDRYEVKTMLGRGGMATVYVAHDPRFERDVALKLLSEQLLDQETFRRRFEREAKTIAALDHPAIVPVYDFGEVDERPFLVMRYMTGGPLADQLAAGPLPLAECARILQRLAGALDEAHAHGIVHRDLKPSNILFDQRNDPFISDFGIAKLTEAHTRLTKTGGMVGTPAYMSPEQLQGDPVDGRADIYALGVLFFEMLSAAHPYENDTPIGMAAKHIFEPAPRVLDLMPDLPPGCQAIINKAMAKSPDDRYQVAAELAKDVQALAHPGATPAVNGDGPPPAQQQRRALIIHTDEYNDPLLGQLTPPGADVAALAQALADPDKGGFAAVQALHNAANSVIRREVARFCAEANETDALFLYVIGHAVVDQRRRLFLATRETEHSLLHGTAVAADFIADAMDVSPATDQILILDCLYSSAGTHYRGGNGEAAIDLSRTFPKHGPHRVLISARQTIQYQWQGDEIVGEAAPSAFTYYFSQGLSSGAADKDKDGRITLQDALDYVQAQLGAAQPAPVHRARQWPERLPTPLPLGRTDPSSPAEGPEKDEIAKEEEREAAIPSHGQAAEDETSQNGLKPDGAEEATSSPARLWRWGGGALIGLLLTLLALFGGRAILTPALSPTATATQTTALMERNTATPSPAPSETPSPTPSPTATASPSPTPSATPSPSATATATPLPSPTPETLLATAQQPSSVFARPDTNSAELAVVDAGAEVEILGRTRVGEWLYVYDGQETIGYVYAPRFTWTGSYEALPIAMPTPPAADEEEDTAVSGCGDEACPPLRLDIYPLPGGRCQGDIVYRTVFMRGQGGDGRYTYYWNGEEMAGPLLDQGYGFEVSAEDGGSVIGAGRVVSGDGQAVSQELFISNFDCTP
jgi:uncharacterized caspase-like protein